MTTCGCDIRVGIGISGGSSLGVGGSLPAIDTGGDEVYPAGGGPDWLMYTIMIPLLILLCAVWAWTVPLAVMRRRRAERQSSLAERERSGGGLQTLTGEHRGQISARHARNAEKGPQAERTMVHLAAQIPSLPVSARYP